MEKNISKAHPLAVLCTINVKGVVLYSCTLQTNFKLLFDADLGLFQFTFSFLPHFSVVCASVQSVTVADISDEQLSTHLDKTSLLHCLLTDGDYGRTSPNAIVSFHIRKHGNEVFSSVVRTYGFPYKWVQNVCGITDDVELPNGNNSNQQQVAVSAENIGTVVSRLKYRFKAQGNLLSQVISLSSGMSCLCSVVHVIACVLM